MKNLVKITILSLLLFSLAVFSPVAKADSLSLVGVGNVQSGGDYIGPYTVSVNGAELPLFCLNVDRNVYVGQLWDATAVQLSSNSSLELREAAILHSMFDDQSITQIPAQLEIWAILRPDIVGNMGLTPDMVDDLAKILLYAQDNGRYGDAFYSEFTVFVSNDGTAQDFLGRSVPTTTTPEPSSLLLLGTGLFGSAGMLYRRARARCQ